MDKIHPALDFTDDVAFVGQMMDSNELACLHLITSDKEFFEVNDVELEARGISLSTHPNTLENRWSKDGITHYIDRGSGIEPDSLLKLIRFILKIHIEFSDERLYDFFTLWIIGTYFHPIFHAYPYVYVCGISGSGKTKLLAVCSELSFNAIFSGSMSTAVSYRLIEDQRCSLFIDETDFLANYQSHEDFRLILLNGYKKGKKVYRNRQVDGNWIPEPFEVYSPKMLANIEGLDKVLESRCISVVMMRGINRTIMEKAVELDAPLWQQTRDLLYSFLMTHWKAIKQIYLEKQNESKLIRRDWELWEPILALAKFFDDGELLNNMKKLAIDKVKESESFRFDNHEAILMETLLDLVKKDEFYSLSTIKNRMAKYFDNDSFLTCRRISSLLRRLGFSNDRRLGIGVQFFLTVSRVQDVARRLGLEVADNGGEGSEGSEGA